MSPPVDWDARPRAYLKYLKHLKDTDAAAHQTVIAKLQADELADVKWAASVQRTGDQQQADDADSVVFSDTEEELQWQNPNRFLASWNHVKAKEHRSKIRAQREEIERREKAPIADPANTVVHELAANDMVSPDQTTTNLPKPPVPLAPTVPSGPCQSTFWSALAATTTAAPAAPGLSTAPPSNHTAAIPEHHGRARHYEQGGRTQTGLDSGRRAPPTRARSAAPVAGPAADVQAIKDIGWRRFTEQSKREVEEMMDQLGRLRTS